MRPVEHTPCLARGVGFARGVVALARGVVVLALALGLGLAQGGALAQADGQGVADAPNPVEAIGNAVRGLFDAIFGGPRKPAPAVPEPAAPPAPVAVPAAPAPEKPAEASAATVPPEAGPSKPDAAFIRPGAPYAKPTPYARATGGLNEAIAAGDRERAIKLLEAGADVHGRDGGSGATPLHYAVMRGDQPMVELLIGRGAEVNSRTRTGMSTLHTAVFYQRLEIAEFLIERGADVNAKSASGVTPAGLAWMARNGPMRDMLQAKGAQ